MGSLRLKETVAVAGGEHATPHEALPDAPAPRGVGLPGALDSLPRPYAHGHHHVAQARALRGALHREHLAVPEVNRVVASSLP